MRIAQKLRKVTALVLLLGVTILQPTNAYAVEAIDVEGAQTEIDFDSSNLTEVVSLREENVKHFDLGNGNYQAVIYAQAVHTLDSSGNWQDIDNTFGT